MDDSIYTCFFLQALYWSLGAGLIEPARIKFDAQVKYLASMTSVDEGADGTAKFGKDFENEFKSSFDISMIFCI